MNSLLAALIALFALSPAFGFENVKEAGYKPYGPYRDGQSSQKFFDKTYKPYGASPYGKHPYGVYGSNPTKRSAKKSLVPDVVEASWRKRTGE